MISGPITNRHKDDGRPRWPPLFTMNTPRRLDLYPQLWRLPLLIWQGLFFVIPLVFMAALSFWLVKNYRMEPAFAFDNWERMLGRGAFWDAYALTLWRAALAGVIATVIAFPASLFLAFHRVFLNLCVTV